MKDTTLLDTSLKRPMHAEGRICIALTDPLTGKVKERVQGKNMTFPANVCKITDWVNGSSAAKLVLTDNTAAIDPAMPFVPGQIVGYGSPSTGSLGTYRGAYNAANQILASQTLTSRCWKFQYDFTTAQANGTIGTIGLTRQFSTTQLYSDNRCFTISGTNPGTSTNDGVHAYSVAGTGVITKINFITGAVGTMDVSAIVGTSISAQIVYFSDTNKYGVYKYVAGADKLYVFSDNTFSTLVITYDIPNIHTYPSYAMYGYGDYLFMPQWTSLPCANYIANTVPTNITLVPNNYSKNESLSNYTDVCPVYSTMAAGKYLFFGFLDSDQYKYKVSGIVDMSTRQHTILTVPAAYFNNNMLFRNPFETSLYLPTVRSDTLMCNLGALAVKKLDTPVVKTSANGMTVTYELEVFY